MRSAHCFWRTGSAYKACSRERQCCWGLRGLSLGYRGGPHPAPEALIQRDLHRVGSSDLQLGVATVGFIISTWEAFLPTSFDTEDYCTRKTGDARLTQPDCWRCMYDRNLVPDKGPGRWSGETAEPLSRPCLPGNGGSSSICLLTAHICPGWELGPKYKSSKQEAPSCRKEKSLENGQASCILFWAVDLPHS